MNPKLFFLSLIFAFSMISCSKETEDLKVIESDVIDGGSLYSNSFESILDLADFEGHSFSLTSDVPTNGGDSSLVVSGGCVVPHLYFDLGPFNEDKNLSVSFYGKSVDQFGGSVFLKLISNPQTNLKVQVQDFEWTLYQSKDVLEVPAGEKVRIEFISGGIVPLITYFDLFKIEEN